MEVKKKTTLSGPDPRSSKIVDPKSVWGAEQAKVTLWQKAVCTK